MKTITNIVVFFFFFTIVAPVLGTVLLGAQWLMAQAPVGVLLVVLFSGGAVWGVRALAKTVVRDARTTYERKS